MNLNGKPEASELDVLDRRIIQALLEDGRKPWQTIAEQLGVDEKTVRNRVARLREQDLLRFTPTLGNNSNSCCLVLVAFEVEPAHLSRIPAIAETIAEIPCVSWVGEATGRYDLVAEIVIPSIVALSRLKRELFVRLEGISRVEEFIITANHGRRGLPFVEDLLTPA